MKKNVVFVPFVLDDFGASGFFGHTALYFLKSYLKQFPSIEDAFSISIYPLSSLGSVPLSVMDRYLLKSLSEILSEKPSLVCFSVYAWSVQYANQVASFIHALSPDTRIMVGGPEVMAREEFAAEWPNFDILVEGDGEVPLKRILLKIAENDFNLSGIPNVSFRGAEGFIHNEFRREFEDCSNLPNFYRDYPEKLSGAAFYLSVRGCPNACKYCQWAKQGLRKKSAEQVLDELTTITENNKIDLVCFFDYDFLDIYGEDLDVARRILSVLVENGNPLIQCFIHLKWISSELLIRFIEVANVDRIYVGLQTSNVESLRAINRAWSIEYLPEIDRVPDEIKKYINFELMYPLPGETLESFISMLEYLIHSGFSMFHIFPVVMLRGTRLRQQAEKYGLRYFSEPPYYCYQTPTFSVQDWFDLAGVAYVITMMTEMVSSNSANQSAWSRYLTQTPDLVRGLLEKVRMTADLDDLLYEVVHAVLGEDCVERSAVKSFIWTANLDSMKRLLPAGNANASVGSKASVRSSEFQSQDTEDETLTLPPCCPTRDEVQAALDSYSVIIEDYLVEPQGCRFSLRDGDTTTIVSISKRVDDEPFFAEVGDCKVRYSGKIKRIEVLEAVMELLKKSKRKRIKRSK